MEFLQYISGTEPSPFYRPTSPDEIALIGKSFVDVGSFRPEVNNWFSTRQFNFADGLTQKIGSVPDFSHDNVDLTNDTCTSPPTFHGSESHIIVTDVTIGERNFGEENCPIIINDVYSPPSVDGNESKPITIGDSSDEEDDVIFVSAGKVQFSSQEKTFAVKEILNEQGLRSKPSLPESKSESCERKLLVVSEEFFSLMLWDSKSGTEVDINDDKSSGYNSAESFDENIEHNLNDCNRDSETKGKTSDTEAPRKQTWTFHRFPVDHSEVSTNYCKLCFVKLGKSQIDRHVRRHEDERTAQCDHCFLIFESVAQLNYHRQTHYKECHVDDSECTFGVLESVKIKCTLCVRSLDDSMELNLHRFDAFCEYCKQKIVCQGFMKEHATTKCEAYKKTYPCKFCKRGFRVINSLNNHFRGSLCKYCKELDQLDIWSGNLESGGFPQCSFCRLFLPTKDGLQLHKKKIECDERGCSRVFRCRTRFLIHILENYDYEFTCKRCSAEFTSYRTLLQHKETCCKGHRSFPKKGYPKIVLGNSNTNVFDRKEERKQQTVGSRKLDGYITVGILNKMRQRSRGTLVKFALKLSRMYPTTYGKHTNSKYLASQIEAVLCKMSKKEMKSEEFFVPKRKKKKKIRRYYY